MLMMSELGWGYLLDKRQEKKMVKVYAPSQHHCLLPGTARFAHI